MTRLCDPAELGRPNLASNLDIQIVRRLVWNVTVGRPRRLEAEAAAGELLFYILSPSGQAIALGFRVRLGIANGLRGLCQAAGAELEIVGLKDGRVGTARFLDVDLDRALCYGLEPDPCA